MSSQTNTMPGSFGGPAVAPVTVTAVQHFYWSVTREVWENRSLYIAPLAAAALILAGTLVSSIHLPAKIRAASTLAPMERLELLEKPYDIAALLLMGTTLIVAIFYCLDALYGERRDRSILFWKSLPVSDRTAVLSKAVIPIVMLPLLTFAITVAIQLWMALLNATALLASGMSASQLWTNVPLLHMWRMLLYHLVAIHGLWYAPFFGWLLLASAWARRAPILWATLPPLAIGLVEKIAFNTSHFAVMLGQRLVGSGSSVPDPSGMDSMMQFSLGEFLSSPGLWIGLALTAAFLAAAVRLRRHRGPV